MGAALIVPVLALIAALAIWVFFAAGKTSKARREAETLPDEPYAREQEQIRRLRAEHEEATADRSRLR